MTIKDKVLKAHNLQIRLSGILAKVGYNTPLGKLLRLGVYYRDALIMIKAWRDFLYIRKENIGDKYFAVDQAIMHSSHSRVNKYFAVDQAIMHSSHSRVRELMYIEPQLRGNDLGIIRILAPSYMLNNPLSLGMNGNEHTGIRAVFLQALPEPLEQPGVLGELVDQMLLKAATQSQLHIGKDLPNSHLYQILLVSICWRSKQHRAFVIADV